MDSPPCSSASTRELGQATSPRWSSPASTPTRAATPSSTRCSRSSAREATYEVHNHHNFAWRERHFGTDVWVIRKGCTPAFPGQEGFVGATMGEPSVILRGVGLGRVARPAVLDRPRRRAGDVAHAGGGQARARAGSA